MVTRPSPRTRRRTLRAAVASLLLVCSACNDDDGDTASSTTSLLPTAPTTVVEPTTTTSPPTSTSQRPDPTTTQLNPPPTITNPATTVTTTVELPPVATLVPEVPDDLLRPEQLDPTDVNNRRPVLPEHLPVLEAHLAAIQATTRASSTWPINPDAPELIAAPLAPEILQRFQDASRARLARGEVLNVEQGVTFRPYVVGPVTDTAVVLDCELAGHYWVKADTGELVPPDEVWPAGPGRIVEVGLSQTLVLRDGRWLVASSEVDPEACG